MRKTALCAVVLALATACTFENPINWDGLVFAAPDSVDVKENDVVDMQEDADAQTDQQVDRFEIDRVSENISDIGDVDEGQAPLDINDHKEAEESVNPCPEGQYPDQHLMKCLEFPCCEISGPWMLQMSNDQDMTVNNYAVAITQKKAYLVMDVLTVVPGSMPLPDSVAGTLTADVLHLDGGDPGTTGFLMMDAKKVEVVLFETGKIFGSFKLLINGEPTASGDWTLTPN